MPPDASLLGLPSELMFHILKSAGPETLVQIRQTCKKLESIARDDFGSEYIKRLECFILEPSRLKRINNIASSPRLVPYVECLNFSLDPMEHKTDDTILFAHRRSGYKSFHGEQQWVGRAYRDEAFPARQDIPENRREIRALLVPILQNLLPHKKAKVCMPDFEDLRKVLFGNNVGWAFEFFQDLQDKFMGAVYESEYPLDALKLVDGRPHKYPGRCTVPDLDDTAQQFAGGLKKIEYVLRTDRRNSHEEQRGVGRPTIEAFVHRATSLEDLSLKFAGDDDDEGAVAVAGLISFRFEFLKSISFARLAVDEDVLAHFLAMHQNSLEEIRFAGDPDSTYAFRSWPCVLALRFPLLKRFSLVSLTVSEDPLLDFLTIHQDSIEQLRLEDVLSYYRYNYDDDDPWDDAGVLAVHLPRLKHFHLSPHTDGAYRQENDLGASLFNFLSRHSGALEVVELESVGLETLHAIWISILEKMVQFPKIHRLQMKWVCIKTRGHRI